MRASRAEIRSMVGEIGRVDQVVNLPRAIALLVDGRDFDREHEPHVRRRCGAGKQPRHLFLDPARQAEEAGLGGHELLAKLRTPGGMREIAGGDEIDALHPRGGGEMLEIEVAAGRAGIFRMDVKIGGEAHRGQPPPTEAAGLGGGMMIGRMRSPGMSGWSG